MPHENRLVDFSLSEPTGLLASEEDFHGHLLPPPAAEPHLTIATLANLPSHLDLLSNGALDLVE